MSGVARIFNPPKPKTPEPSAEQTAALEAQRRNVEAETKRINDAEAKAAAAEGATNRARLGRQRGRALLLNDELGVAAGLQSKVGS